MPIERFAYRYGVNRDVMCQIAPEAVEEMMRALVCTVSPQWETVRIEIVEGAMNTWDMHLIAVGIRRPGGDRG